MIRIKRIYELAEGGDGKRILVDRLWPRGISRESARVDEWLREVAPSDGLRKWFGHNPDRWAVFRNRYREELLADTACLELLRSEAGEGMITLLYAAKDRELNNAVVLKELLEEADGTGPLQA